MPPAEMTIPLAVPPLRILSVALLVTRMLDAFCPAAIWEVPLETCDDAHNFASRACQFRTSSNTTCVIFVAYVPVEAMPTTLAVDPLATHSGLPLLPWLIEAF